LRPPFRFDAFVFYRETGALQRNGHAVRLSEQASKVLSALLEHPGELVTRAQLTEVLWPGGVYTEGNQGINNIISKLRVTLRDDPKKPRFIETIPQRGYRFVSPLLTDETHEPPQAATERTLAPIPNLAASAVDPPTPIPPAHPSRRRWLAWLTVAVLLVTLFLGGFTLWKRREPAPASGHGIALAVAPFETTGAAPDSQQLAESFRLDLIDALSQLPGIEVRAAHSVGLHDAPETRPGAAPLHLDAILFTHFSQKGDSCEFELEMVRSGDSTHLNAWHYSGSTAQLGAIRDQMQRDIFTYWKGSAGTERAAKGGTEDTAAYELYLRARYHARQRTPDSLQDAVKEYQQALARDPHFAKAYAGLADAHFALGSYMVADSRGSYAQAETFAAKALELAPDLAEAHAILGYMYFHNDWRFTEGEREIRHAIVLEPNEPTYHVWYAEMLTELQRFPEASSELETAKRDDPYWAPIYASEAYLAASSHQADRMNAAANTLVSLKPDWPGSYDELAWSDWLSGQPEKAIAQWRKMAIMQKDANRVALEDRGIAAFRRGGEKAYTKLRLQAAIQFGDKNPGDPDFQIAEWQAYDGDYEGALLQLKKMVDTHDMRALEIAVNPAYTPLHHDPRYRELLRRIGLPKAEY
jgi:DNA-binding winged helix-turn-helix (wHTH) protein/Tfp pilus assembly protein PilF/TolB-like protein